MAKDGAYIGNELEIFKLAENWKNYWLSQIKPFLGNHVLEVGAGIGENVRLLAKKCTKIRKLTAIEPDEMLAKQIVLPANTGFELVVRSCFLSDFSQSGQTEKFDSILYIDVLEHIEKDAQELALAKSFLKKGGFLVILVPAHNFLFSPFDKAIGHFRRYNKKMLSAVAPAGLTKRKLVYLDSLGLMASLTNKFFLKQSYPTQSQILKWDRLIIPPSKVSDRLLFYTVGKSLVGVWENV